jgi:uncharacterized membrane protein
MQLLFFLIAAVIVVSLVFMVLALIAAIVMTVAVVLGVAIPAYLVFQWWRRSQMPGLTQKPLERLQNLYVEGKIDIFEFERRVANLIAVEH